LGGACSPQGRIGAIVAIVKNRRGCDIDGEKLAGAHGVSLGVIRQVDFAVG